MCPTQLQQDFRTALSHALGEAVRNAWQNHEAAPETRLACSESSSSSCPRARQHQQGELTAQHLTRGMTGKVQIAIRAGVPHRLECHETGSRPKWASGCLGWTSTCNAMGPSEGHLTAATPARPAQRTAPVRLKGVTATASAASSALAHLPRWWPVPVQESRFCKLTPTGSPHVDHQFCGPRFKSPACRARCSGELVETA
jgi:hypothetical protein